LLYIGSENVLDTSKKLEDARYSKVVPNLQPALLVFDYTGLLEDR
jgi:hypothetical protein